MKAPLHSLEHARLKALRQYAVLDTPPEQEFDDLTHLAAQICDTPFAALTLIDEDRQWFKSRVGWDFQETPREVSFCAHTILESGLLVVPDATVDERFADNPFVTGSPCIRFYAGMLLVTPLGHVVGTLCVFDTVSRQLELAQQDALCRLARQALALLEARLAAIVARKSIQDDRKEGQPQRFPMAKTAHSALTRLDSIVESSDDAIISKTLDGIITTWNAGAERMYGYSAQEMIGQSISILVPPDMPDEMPQLLEKVGRGHLVDHYETRRVRKNGASIEISLSISPLKDAQGKIIGASSIKRDITSRKSAEQQLRMHSQLLNALGQAVIVTDLAGTITYWNDSAERLYGWTAFEAMGQDILNVAPIDTTPEQDVEILACLLRGDSWQGELLAHRRSGTPFSVQVIRTPVRDGLGQLVSIIGLSLDITPQKRVEEKLRSGQADLARAQHMAHVGSWELDLSDLQDINSNPLTWSDEIFRIFGYEPGQIEVTNENFFRAVHPDDRERVRATMEAAIQENHPYSINHRVVWPNGAVRIIHELGDIVRDEVTGVVLKIAGVAQDITESKEAEMDLVASELRFRTAIAEAPIPIMIHREDGQVLQISKGWTKYSGYELEDVRTIQDWAECAYGESSPEAHEYIKQLYGIEETRSEGEWTITAKNGQQRVWDFTTTPLGTFGDKQRVVINTAFDITERQQAEASLIDSQQRLLLATNSAQIGVWDWDVVAQKIVWDTQMVVLYGIQEQDFCGAYEAWQKSLHPEDRDRAEADVAAALEGRENFRSQFRVIWPNGEVHWLIARGIVQRADDGRALRMIGVSWDITKRKEGELAVRRSEERYRSLALATAQIVWTASADGMMEDIPAWRDFTGQTVEEAQGKGWIQALHPSDRERLGKALDNCAEIGVYEDEYRVRSSDGEYRLFAVRGVPIWEEDGSVREWVGTFTDIQDQRRAEEERDRFFTLSLDMLAIAGLDGYFKRINPAFLETLGWTEAEFLSTPFLELSHPDDDAATQKAVEKLAQGNAVVGFQNRYRTKQGGWRWLEWKSVAVLEEGLIYAAARDVTERNASEAALLAMHDELGARVLERTDELAQANESLRVENIQHQMTMDTLRQLAEALQLAKEEADAANLAKSEFLSRMSHELRTPLNAILGFGQVLEGSTLTPRQQESIGYILKGGRHLLALINEVLDIARVEAGHVDLSLEPVALQDVVPEVCALVRPLAQERHIHFEETTLQIGRCYILADLQRLKQVLLNLFSNAIKYNREGGLVEISSSLDPEGWVAIAIRDTGPGISPEDLLKLFMPFERLGAASSTIEGTGLGLVLSQRLVTAMGGTLEVKSILGQGTTFTLKLPQTPSPADQVTNVPEDIHLAPISEPFEQSYSVLCIEDNPSNLRLIEAILESRPEITLLSAMQGSIGLDLARQHDPHLILLDLDLPDIKGNEVLLRLQQSAITRDIPVVIVSADATPGQIERLLSGGAKAYLTKPLDVGLFLETINQFLAITPTAPPATTIAPALAPARETH